MRSILVLTIGLVYLLLFSVQISHSENSLRVGMELSYPPFEMSNSKNEPEGISVEIAKAVANGLGRNLRIVNMSFDGLIPSLKTGKIDLIISSMTITDERQKAVDFSDPYIKTGLAILANNQSKIYSAKDLDSTANKIAVKKGTTAHIWALNNIYSAKILLLDKESSAVLEVAQGKADAFLYDQISVFRHWSKNKHSTRAILEPFQSESWGIALPKGDPTLKTEINSILEDLKKSGEFSRLSSKYFPNEIKAFEEFGVKFIF